MKNVLRSFRRITSSNNFIPEIDGLRFVAIASVVLYHLNTFIIDKYSTKINGFLISFFTRGHLGVELFFVISGLILSYPFASFYLKNTKKPRLKDYFLRRLTRLEPPYIICMLLLFIALIMMGKFTVQTLLPSLLASLTYTHNLFFPKMLPLINGVAWSLEVEIQFYIIAPILTMIFLLPNKFRRVTILGSILFFILLKNIIHLPFVWLLDYLYLFLVGFFLTDLLITNYKININKTVLIMLGSISFILIWFFDYKGDNLLFKIFNNTGLFISILAFCSIALFNTCKKNIFRIQAITIIGGMCYSIYLFHYAIISFFGNVLIHKLSFGNYIVDYIIYAIILILLVLIVCATYYKLIEQPCMKRNWYMPIINKFKKKIKQEAVVIE